MAHNHEARRRSIIKAVTFRILAVISHTTIIYLVTRQVGLTVGLVILTNLANTILYYLHERIWNRANWGRAAADVAE